MSISSQGFACGRPFQAAIAEAYNVAGKAKMQ
jgi:hypothetical protein